MASNAVPGPVPAPVPTHLAEHEDDENAWQPGYVKGTDFSLPYISPWSKIFHTEVGQGLYRHINCGYLSTTGVAPTLVALKQHAQSLCILIQALDPSIDPTVFDAAPKQTPDVNRDELPKPQLKDAFDFLADITVPYTNDDPHHNKPLTMLLNSVRGRHEAYGTSYHCPLAEVGPPREKDAPQKPYATHSALAMHANACLERLDHEFSSTGGILSLLPTSEEHDTTDLANCRSSLLGQWLLFSQQLVARLHELELSYANALDALAGEAAIPHQYLSELGPDGRSGREIVYPQDKWVLVNAGDDVFCHVHNILDKQEALVQTREKAYRSQGVLGDQIWKKFRNGAEYARGIIPVTIPTRYYRLAGKGHHTLFVLPAWDNHPGVAYTRELEEKPSIVACVQPKFPIRASELEKKYDERVERAKQTEIENLEMRSEAMGVQEELRTLRAQNEMLARTRDALLLNAGPDVTRAAKEIEELRGEVEKYRQIAESLKAQVGMGYGGQAVGGGEYGGFDEEFGV